MPRGINSAVRQRSHAMPVHTTRGAGFQGGEAPDLSGVGPQGPHVPTPPQELGPMIVHARQPENPSRWRHFHFRGFPGRGRFDY
jgi:hypothetical protein